jgi:large subunit ribosomal protein L32
MVIRMRHTRAHTANRRSHHALSASAITTDKETGATHLRHRASRDGIYKGKQAIKPVEKKSPVKSTKTKKAVK